MTSTPESGPSLDQLTALGTEELKERATSLARSRGDVAFLWELVKHLPESRDFAGEDGATTGIVSTLNDVLALFEEIFGRQIDNIPPEQEALLRARFVDYIMRHS